MSSAFDQEIRDGWQWKRRTSGSASAPVEICRPEISYYVNFGGHTEQYLEKWSFKVRWVPYRVVRGIAYDTPVPSIVTTWWTCSGSGIKAWSLLTLRRFNVGDYYRQWTISNLRDRE